MSCSLFKTLAVLVLPCIHGSWTVQLMCNGAEILIVASMASFCYGRLWNVPRTKLNRLLSNLSEPEGLAHRREIPSLQLVSNDRREQ